MTKLLVIFLILIGFFLRTYHLESLAGFDYDGEKMAFWVQDLLVNHKFSLIGQEISTGGVYIGPIYYYLLTPVYYLFNLDPIAANVFVSTASVGTMFLVYKLAATLFGQKTGLLTLLLYAISFRINFYDRTTAPSNLVMFLSLAIALLTLTPATFKKNIILGILLGFSFSIHPTAVLLILCVAFVNFKRLWSVATVVPLIFLTLPLLIFDFRHDHLIASQIASLLFSPQYLDQKYPFFFKAISNARTVVTSFGQIFVPATGFLNGPINLLILAIIFHFLLWLKKNVFRTLFFVWVLVPIVALSFYPKVIPEYYFLLSLPFFLTFFSQYLSQLPKVISALLGLVAIITNLSAVIGYQNPYNLGSKKKVVEYILASSGQKSIRVDYNLDASQKFGFDYLFSWKNEAPRAYARGIFSPLLRRERNPSEAEDSSHSSPDSRPGSSAKGDKVPLSAGDSHYIIVAPPNRTGEPGEIIYPFKVLRLGGPT